MRCLRLLPVLAVLVTACGGGGDGPLLASRLGGDGGVVLLDPDGGEVTGLELEGTLVATRTTTYGALVQVDGAGTLVVVRPGGEVIDLDLPGALPALPTFRGGGDRFVLVGQPDGSTAALVDVEAGTATDLLDPLGVDHVFGGRISEDEAWAVVQTSDGPAVISTADPAAGASPSREHIAIAVGPGGRVAWSERAGDDDEEITTFRGTLGEDGALEEGEEVPSAPLIFDWAGDTLVGVREGEVVRAGEEDGEAVADVGGEITGLQCLSERFCVARVDEDVHVVDLDTGAVEDLGERALLVDSEEWVAFASTTVGDTGEVRVLGLDDGRWRGLGVAVEQWRPLEIAGDTMALADVEARTAAVADMLLGVLEPLGPALAIGLSPDGGRFHITRPPADPDAELTEAVSFVGSIEDPEALQEVATGLSLREWLASP